MASTDFLANLNSRLPESLRERNREELQKISRNRKLDLAPPGGGNYSREDWLKIDDRIVAELAKRLLTQNPATAWDETVRQFHSEKQWGFRASLKSPERKETSAETKEMLPYLWVLLQAVFIMKIVIYYFGLTASNEPSAEHDLYLYLALAFSACSLAFFAVRMYRREARDATNMNQKKEGGENGKEIQRGP